MRLLYKLLIYILCFFFLALVYEDFISTVFGYEGYKWEPNSLKILEAYGLLIILALLTPNQIRKPSDFLLHFQLLFPILPMLVLYGFSDKSRAYILLVSLCFCIVSFLSHYLKPKLLRIPNIDVNFLKNLAFSIGLLYVLVIIALGGLRFLNFDFTKIYEFRTTSEEALPPIFNRLSPMVAKVFLPFVIILSLKTRSHLYIFLSTAICILAFGLTAHRGTIFYPFLVLSFYFLLKHKESLLFLLLGYLSVMLIVMIAYYLDQKNIIFGSVALRRTFFVPANLNFLYYEFFSQNPLVYWADSKVSLGLVQSYYPTNISQTIGDFYFPNQQAFANTGWIGSGYANGGVSGLFIYSIMLGIFFSMLNVLAKYVDTNIIISVLFPSLISLLISSDFFTSFLTHGVLLSFILLLFTFLKNSSKLKMKAK